MNENFPESVRPLQRYIAARLTSVYDLQEAENIAKVLLLDLFEIKQNSFILNEKIHFSDKEIRLLHEAIKRLLDHEPVQQVCGKAHFFGRTFAVNQQVLIPRPETEELVKWVLDTPLPAAATMLDIGTGSGCIAISLALEKREANVDAMDISAPALEVARKNAIHHHAVINFIREDILSINALPSFYDVIISNPPYIPLSQIKEMHRNVTHYEPHQALFVADDDPLVFYRKIAALALSGLRENGFLFFEIHEEKAPEILDLLGTMAFRNVEVKQDLQGKNRMIRAQTCSQT